MKLKNNFLPAILMFGAVALSSCEKNESLETASPVLEQGAISHILADSAELTSFTYKGKQLSQVNNYNKESGELESFEKYEHDSKGRLTKTTTYAASNHAVLSEQTFTYNASGLLIKTNTSYFNNSNLEYSSYTTYDYDTAKKLRKKSVYEGAEGKTEEEGQLKSYTEYELLPNGNYSLEKQYVIDATGEAKLFSTTTFSYDTSINPFYELAEPGTASSPNNLIASTTEVHGSKKTYKYTYAYKYDERGLPVSQAVTTPSSKQENYIYRYSN